MPEPTNQPSTAGAISPVDPQTGAIPTTTPSAIPEVKEPAVSLEDAHKEIARLSAELKKVHTESKNHRLKADELDALKKQIEDEKLTETDKLKKQLAEIQSQRDEATRSTQEKIITYEVQLQASKMGIVDPEAAVKLLDWSEIEYNDNGTPKNVQELLDALVKAKPYLGNTQSPAGQQHGRNTPALPAMNPGRASITSPSQLPAGKPIRFSDIYGQKS